MRKFDPEKELYKIQKGNQNKIIIIGVVALLIIIAIGSSYALYQVRYSKRIIYTKVSPFYNKDIQLAVYVDGVKQKEFPGKDDGYVFDNISCDKPGIKASFNNDTWELTLTTGTTNKCNVKFITKPYIDGSGANYPDLFQGLIPIRYENGKIYIADYKEKWYDYNNNEWANAVLIDHTNEEVMKKFYTDGKLNVNTEITTDDILQMYVWIPRYKYQLWNAKNESKPKQIINIKFENTIETTGDVSCTYTDMKDGTILEDCKNAENGNWYTHPAFSFGDTQLRGIWVGKFEPSDPTNLNGRNNINKINEITILPNKTSLVNNIIKTMFDAEQKLIETGNKYDLNSKEIDTRVMKNIEWGAVAYLTQSIYGIYQDESTCNIEDMTKDECEVWINNTAQGAGTSGKNYNFGGTYTGCVGDTVSAGVKWNNDDGSVAKCDVDKQWNTGGVKASTTGNMYGIYDMSGGTWEYVMGVTKSADGTDIYYAYSGFDKSTIPNPKYYDIYSFDTESTTFERGHLGDATREILRALGNRLNGWNGDASEFPSGPQSSGAWSWIGRSTNYYSTTGAGIFAFIRGNDGIASYTSFRSVLSAA